MQDDKANQQGLKFINIKYGYKQEILALKTYN